MVIKIINNTTAKKIENPYFVNKTIEMFNTVPYKYSEAGSKSGGHWTPFKETRDKFINYVKEHPGCTYKEAVENITHHYSSNNSARSAFSNLIGSVIKNIEYDWEKKGLFFLGDK